MELDYLMYSKVSPHWTLVHNGVATLPVKYSLQGGSRGGGCNLWEPPLGKGIGGSAPNAKNRCKIAL